MNEREKKIAQIVWQYCEGAITADECANAVTLQFTKEEILTTGG